MIVFKRKYIVLYFFPHLNCCYLICNAPKYIHIDKLFQTDVLSTDVDEFYAAISLFYCYKANKLPNV